MSVREDWKQYSAPQKTLLVIMALCLAASLGFVLWPLDSARFPVILFMVWWIGSILILKAQHDRRLGLDEPLILLMITCLAASVAYTWNIVSATEWNWMTVLAGALLVVFLAIAHKSRYLPSWRSFIEAHELERRAHESYKRVPLYSGGR